MSAEARLTPVAPVAGTRTSARVAGILYLSLVPLGVLSFVYVPSVVVVRGDAGATCRNIGAHEALFRAGVASHLLSQVIVVFLAFTLYRLLRDTNRDRAAMMAALALLCVAISFVSEAYSLAALRNLPDAGEVAPASPHAQEQAMLLLDLRRSGVLLAQVFWGLWVVALGSLVFASGFLPRWLAIPLFVAAAGYLIDSASHVLLPSAPTIGRFTAVGELPLPLWLATKGLMPRPGDPDRPR